MLEGHTNYLRTTVYLPYDSGSDFGSRPGNRLGGTRSKGVGDGAVRDTPRVPENGTPSVRRYRDFPLPPAPSDRTKESSTSRPKDVPRRRLPRTTGTGTESDHDVDLLRPDERLPTDVSAL